MTEKIERLTRRIWVAGDTHIGCADKADGRDGADWFRLALEDVQAHLGPLDYALFLGDMTHHSRPDEFRAYVELRDSSYISTWYEIAGNHDFQAVKTGAYARWVKCPLRFTVLDGNCAWFFASAERGGAAGWMSDETVAWLRDSIRSHEDKNIIVCTHQLVYGTVRFSTSEYRYLHREPHPKEWVDDFLKEVRVDLWLGGHAHFHSRDKEAPDPVKSPGPPSWYRRGHTTFINIASITHAYNTEACLSYLLVMKEGTKRAEARCRIHDHPPGARWARQHSVQIQFPHAWKFQETLALIEAPV